MSMKPVNEDLGYTYSERYGGAQSEPVNPKDDEKIHYPSFSYDDEGEPLDIPDKGKMLIEFEEIERTESVRDGKKHYHCVIAVKKIISADGPKDERPSKSDTSTSDALDKLAKALADRDDDDDDDDDDDEQEGY